MTSRLVRQTPAAPAANSALAPAPALEPLAESPVVEPTPKG